jgi:peptidase M28-like protein/WD40 repeat protein
MKRILLSTAAVIAALWMPAWGRVAETPLQTATLAWERGEYATALTAYLQILDSPDAAAALEAIALQTGELYHTTELTSDGQAPLFSPDGRHVAYETGSGVIRRTRVVPVDGTTTPVLELYGSAAAFSVDGKKIAYLGLPPVGEVITAQAAVEAATPADRPQRQNMLDQLVVGLTGIRIHDIGPGPETTLETGRMRKTSLAFGANAVFFTGSPPEGGPAQIFEVIEGRSPVARTTGDTDKVISKMNAPGTALFFTNRPAAGGRGGGAGRAGGPGAATATFGVLSLADGRTAIINGTAPAFSRDGSSFAYVTREGAETRLMIARTAAPENAVVVRKGPERIDAPAFSPDGSRLAFQMMVKDDWELFTMNRDGTGDARVTREIQHDIAPIFLTADRILAAMGEPRHRRSYLYDLPEMIRTRLFHNNTVRTIAPEYSWTPSPDGTKVLIAAERDGDTVSAERGVYLMDLSRRVTREEVRARVKANLDGELSLVAKGKRMYAPIAADVKRVVADASVQRIYGYEKTLFDFDSKHVTQPGNTRAAAFLFDTYKSFGYEPEYQRFDYRIRNGPTGPTANVVATLKGTVNPELIYVVSSHYDSVAVGPGADDDTSGTAALLETARILAGHPQPATIIFASFTGEEAGLLGSREFVRRAVAGKLNVVGALNNDMIGWANDHRLDNTIRYSNAGIRDIQHAAAMQFSNLITYDALYYKSTDAAAYYEAYGDIVGGIGSYPVLGNPHYHQSHDLLEGMNHQLITEVSKTTAATLMLLASSPSRLKGLTIDSFKNGSATLSWTPSPEKGVTGYIVAYGPASNPDSQHLRVVKPSATLTGIAAGTVVSVKAVNAKSLEGWDWVRVTVK